MSERVEQPDDLISGKFCPSCGYDMTGHARAKRVTCPECGNVHRTSDLQPAPPPSRFARAINEGLESPFTRILIVVAIVSFGLGLFLPQMGSTGRGYRLTQRESNLRNISSAAFTFAAENRDLMPPHLGDLIVDGYLGGDLFVDPELDVQQRRAFFYFVPISSLDYSPESRALVAAAMELEDGSASYYRFGDVFFPRFPQGWRMSQIPAPEVTLQYWTPPNEHGERAASFFDGHIETIEASHWRGVWQRDMQERIKMGVPVLSRTAVMGEDE